MSPEKCRGSNQTIHKWSQTEFQMGHTPKGICEVCGKAVATYAASMGGANARDHEA